MPGGHRDISAHEAREFIAKADPLLLDVRSPKEHAEIGHIPGSLLHPIDFIVSACAAIPRDGRAIVVYCEHGIRSVHACRYLEAAGFENLYNLVGGMSAWPWEREFCASKAFTPYAPSSWLLECAAIVPREGRALDVACGRGRHAVLLAAIGLDVHAIDRNEEAITSLGALAEAFGYSIDAEVRDLESGPFLDGRECVDLGSELYDLVLVTHYLHRPLFPALLECLRPNGVLIYETFTLEQATRGKPSNPDFLLRPGELKTLVEPLDILAEREGELDDRFVAGIAARKPSSR